MVYNKKVGVVLMVASSVVAIISFLSSSCDCNLNNDNMHLLARIMDGSFRIKLFSESETTALYGTSESVFSQTPTAYASEITGYFIDIPTKYALFLCLATSALGLLYYLEVFNAPRKRTSDHAASAPDK